MKKKELTFIAAVKLTCCRQRDITGMKVIKAILPRLSLILFQMLHEILHLIIRSLDVISTY